MKVSVITATWNCQETIANCLDSISGQSHKDVEHIVIDGGSRDGTIKKLQERRKQIDVLVSEPDQGIYDALNKGISKASGEIIGFLHADDEYASSDVLAEVISVFKDESVSAVYGDLKYVSKNDSSRVVRYWRSDIYKARSIAFGWMPPHPTLFVRKSWYERVGYFDVNYKISADYLSILQLFTHAGFNALYIPKTLVLMRLGGASNKNLKAVIRKTSEDWRALRRSGFGLSWALVAVASKNIRKIFQFLK